MNYRQSKKFYKKRKHRRYDRYREQVVIDTCSKYANENDMIYIVYSRDGKRIQDVKIFKDVNLVGASGPNECEMEFHANPSVDSSVQEVYDNWKKYLQGENNGEQSCDVSTTTDSIY